MHTPEGPDCEPMAAAQACVELQIGPGAAAPASTAVAPASPAPSAHTIAGVDAAASGVPTTCPPSVAQVALPVAVGACVPLFGMMTCVHAPAGNVVATSLLVQRNPVVIPDEHVTALVGDPHVHGEHCAGGPEGSATPDCCTAPYGDPHAPTPASAVAMRSCT